jgi:hypothetical protein
MRCQTGPETDIKAMFDLMVVKRDGGDEFDFNRLIPMPQEIEGFLFLGFESGEHVPMDGDLLAGDKLVPVEKEKLDDWRTKYGATNWYDWACNNWGTKWNADDFRTDYQGGSLANFSFNTAWAFPNPIADALSKKFPSLRFVWKTFDEAFIQDPEYHGEACEYHGGQLVSQNWYERRSLMHTQWQAAVAASKYRQ